MPASFSSLIISSLVSLSMLGPVAPHFAVSDLNRIRPLTSVLDDALLDGYRSSPTMRRVIEELAASDVIIHIVSGIGARTAGTTVFVTCSGGHRFLRVTIDAAIAREARTAILGHE